MELVNLYIWGGIGAAFCLYVGVLIGHCLRERDYAATIKFQADTHNKWREEHASDLEDAQRAWLDNAKYRKVLEDACTAHGLPVYEPNGHSPMVMLTNLCIYVAECAIDPKQNQKAKNLYVKGVRAGAKKGREQMRKLMQKSIDNQAMTINEYSKSLNSAHTALNDWGTKHALYRVAIINTLNDKVGLVGVRKSIRQAILTEYHRLRAVETNKGE